VTEDPGVGVMVYKFNAKQMLGTKGPKYLPQVENAISVTKIFVEDLNDAVNIYGFHGNILDRSPGGYVDGQHYYHPQSDRTIQPKGTYTPKDSTGQFIGVDSVTLRFEKF
ncbi:MAG: hypothetical protein OEW75_11300, partial [Cyclobacteriaceae bacterium]|nr:hypothetical protein [Cyclobacteriaceae bacterium]